MVARQLSCPREVQFRREVSISKEARLDSIELPFELNFLLGSSRVELRGSLSECFLVTAIAKYGSRPNVSDLLMRASLVIGKSSTVQMSRIGRFASKERSSCRNERIAERSGAAKPTSEACA